MKKKTKIIIIIVVLVFATVSVAGFAYLCKVFENKDSRIDTLLSEPEDTLDGVYLGTSAAYDFWMPTRAYENQGFCIYNGGTTVQPLSTEKYILETLIPKQKNMKVIVIELRNIIRVGNEDMEEYIKKVTDNIPLSSTRIKAVNDTLAYYSGQDAKINYNKWSYYFPGLRVVHFRNYDLDRDDLMLKKNSPAPYKGYNTAKGFKKTVQDDFVNSTKESPLPESSEKVVKDLIDYCKTLDQNVLFVSAPFNPDEEHLYKMEQMNYVCNMIEDSGLTVLNFNHDPLKSQLGMDWSCDYFDRAHANMNGAMKYTDFLADYIDEEYDMPDHRGDSRYSSWDEQAKLLKDKIEEMK